MAPKRSRFEGCVGAKGSYSSHFWGRHQGRHGAPSSGIAVPLAPIVGLLAAGRCPLVPEAGGPPFGQYFSRRAEGERCDDSA